MFVNFYAKLVRFSSIKPNFWLLLFLLWVVLSPLVSLRLCNWGLSTHPIQQFAWVFLLPLKISSRKIHLHMAWHHLTIDSVCFVFYFILVFDCFLSIALYWIWYSKGFWSLESYFMVCWLPLSVSVVCTMIFTRRSLFFMLPIHSGRQDLSVGGPCPHFLYEVDGSWVSTFFRLAHFS